LSSTACSLPGIIIALTDSHGLEIKEQESDGIIRSEFGAFLVNGGERRKRLLVDRILASEV